MVRTGAFIDSVHIFAVGGGGFTHEQIPKNEDHILEDYLLALTLPHPNIGYIGHASNDDPDRIKAFYACFKGIAKTSHLPIMADLKAAEAFVDGLDVLYVGGGSTLKMLSHWRQTGIDKVLLNAGQRGMILSGVSAGAICWFDKLLLSTQDDDYILADGLGLVGGSICPHYRNEPHRKAAYEAQIVAGNLPSGLAIDDGVGVYIKDAVVLDIIRAGIGNAYLVTSDKTCHEQKNASGQGMACNVSILEIGYELVF